MSHEYQTRPITYIEVDYEYDNEFGIEYDTVNGFVYIEPIPDFFTQEFQGLYYDGVSYSWDEIEYRMSVEYTPSVPEPSLMSLTFGIIALGYVFLRKAIKWLITLTMECMSLPCK